MTSTTPYTSWQLAHLADCAEPDEHDGRGFEPPAESREGSHGARFLRLIEDGASLMLTLSLMEEITRYLAAVDAFRAAGCTIAWRKEA